MTYAALAFAAGAAALQLQAALPPLAWAWIVALLAALALTLRSKPFWIASAFAAGFFWAAAAAQWRIAERLSPELEGRDIALVGVVAGLPSIGERSVRFELDVESSEARLPKRILLAWYAPAPKADATPVVPSVHPGERWALTVRLQRPHGLVNPHGLDYEAWLLERGIGATGYVRAGQGEALLGARKG